MKDSQYYNLCSLVNKNLSLANQEPVIFESEFLLSENNFKFDVSCLIKIESDIQFIYDCYYMLLMRQPENNIISTYEFKLKNKMISRKEFIDKIVSSEEFSRKNC